MFRSLRALWLFWSILADYGFQWLLEHLLGKKRLAARRERLHERSALRLAQGFVSLRGIFIKLGQVLSVLGGFLPPAYGRALERLQDQVPPNPFSDVEARLTAALGPDALDRFASFDHEALAAASLAQVHRATSHDGRELAVKVLYPNVAALIRGDMAVLRSVVPVVRRVIGLPQMARALAQLEVMLAHETDYDNERKNIARLASLFEGRDDVVVPAVVDELCGEGVLTMSYEAGHKISDVAAYQDQISPEDVARLLVDCYLTMLVRAQVFHADPHPGNFLVRTRSVGDTQSAVLVILDYGAVEPVSDALADGMKQVVMGAMMKSPNDILLGLERMGFVAEGGDRQLLADVGRDYLKALGQVKIDDFSRMDRDAVKKLAGYEQTRGRLREIMRHVAYPDGFFYVERTLVLLFGLVGKLAPKVGLPGLVGPLALRLFAG